MTTPLKYKPFLLLLLISILLGSCTEEVATEMILNDEIYSSSTTRPSPSDKAAYYEVNLAPTAKIIAVDRSTPSESVTKRKWVLKNQNGKVIFEKSKVPNIDIECEQAGWYSVYLEVNGQTEDAKTCWIYAKSPGNAKIGENESTKNSFEILFPKDNADFTTKKNNIELVLRTPFVEKLELDSIEVKLNDREIKDLQLDLKEALTTARLYLKEGPNTIEIKAEIGGEVFEKKLVVERDKKFVKPEDDPEDDKKSNTAYKFQGEKVENELLDLKNVSEASETCGSKQIIEIKAERPIQLRKVYFAPTACGYYNYKLKDASGKVITGRKYNALTALPTSITLYDEVLGLIDIPRMKPGETWTLELELKQDPDQESCPDKPEIKSLSIMGLESPNSKHLQILSGKEAIYKIDYTY